MKLVAYTRFQRRDPRTGKLVKSRHKVPLEEVPQGAEPIGVVEMREVAEPGDDESSRWPIIRPPKD